MYRRFWFVAGGVSSDVRMGLGGVTCTPKGVLATKTGCTLPQIGAGHVWTNRPRHKIFDEWHIRIKKKSGNVLGSNYGHS